MLSENQLVEYYVYALAACLKLCFYMNITIEGT